MTQPTLPIGRAAALIVLLIVVNLWTMDQFGIGLSDPGPLAIAIAGLSVGIGLVAKMMRPSERKGAERILVTVGRRLLSPPFLAAMYLLFGAVALTSSSVRIVNETADEYHVAVSPAGSPSAGAKRLLKTNALERFRFSTSPYGRAVRVSADGFLPATFTVYSVVGLTVRIPADLRPAPTILFRPDVDALGVLKDGGSIRVRLVSPDSLLASATKQASSFMLGYSQPIPLSFVDDWRLELGGVKEGARGRTLLAWKHVAYAVPPVTLVPGWELRAEIVGASGDVVARVQFKVQHEAFQDVLVKDLPADSI
jgi:hypothetical protein